MSTCNQEGASKSNDDAYEVIEKLQHMSTDVNDTSVCANCGKEGANNICNKCKVTTYCNAVCKKVHKKKHKKNCEEHIRLAAEKHNENLRLAAELHDIELFKQPPPADECPICFEQMPSMDSGSRYQACCGKMICSGCCYAPVYDNQGNKVDNEKCAFCRTPPETSNDEIVKRIRKRVNVNDPKAMHCMGTLYSDGRYGLPQDDKKALELFHRAAELGNASAYCGIGVAYDFGSGVERDPMKANHYYELAAKAGSVRTRHNLGSMEGEKGNMDRALKHFMIAVEGGSSDSLKCIQDLYTDWYATKDDYTKALQLYQTYLGEIKSKQRDEAAAEHENCRYY